MPLGAIFAALNGIGLSRLLKGYEIKAEPVRIGDLVQRGFKREDFHEAWKRYLPPLGANRVTAVTSGTSPAEWSADEAPDVTLVTDG